MTPSAHRSKDTMPVSSYLLVHMAHVHPSRNGSDPPGTQERRKQCHNIFEFKVQAQCAKRR